LKRSTQSRAMQKPTHSDRQRFASVWDAIEDTPEEAARMRALSKSKMEAETVASVVVGQWPAASHVVCAPALPWASPLRGLATR
jgi:hypothetical protein